MPNCELCTRFYSEFVKPVCDRRDCPVPENQRVEAMPWKMEAPARRLCERLWPSSDQRAPQEILRLADDLAGIVVDVDGVDYILTMQRVPNQRPKPKTA